MSKNLRSIVWLDSLQSYWPVVSVYCLGIALAFNVGYFRIPFGHDPYAVTIEDLAKSFLYAILLAVILQNLIHLIDDLSTATSKIHRVITGLLRKPFL